MQPKTEGVLLETSEEATIINPLAGRRKTDVEPGQLTRVEASMAFAKLDQQWQILPIGIERDRQHQLAEELGIAIIRSGNLRHAYEVLEQTIPNVGALAVANQAVQPDMPRVA